MSKSKEDKVYCIYMHTSPSGKSYIGQTSNYDARCNNHRSSKTACRAFANAIAKYGWDSFSHSILIDGLSVEKANRYEEFYIKEYNTIVPNGYNLHSGGRNHTVCKETIDKMVKTNMSKSPEERAGIKQKELDTRNNRTDEQKQQAINKYTRTFYSKPQEELDAIYKQRGETFKNKTDVEKQVIIKKRKDTKRLNLYGTLDEDIIKEAQDKRKSNYAKEYRVKNIEKYQEYDKKRVRVLTAEQKIKRAEKAKQRRIDNKEELNRRERERYAEKQRLKKLEIESLTEET